MKITDVKTLVMGTSWRNLTFVVETDEGLTGVSEVRMNTRIVRGCSTFGRTIGIDGSIEDEVRGAHPTHLVRRAHPTIFN